MSRPRLARPDELQSAAFAVELYGAGQVGGALLAALAERGIPVGAIHRRRGVERRPVAAATTVLVDATPPRIAGVEAESWVAFLEGRLRAGVPVVTCNKAPLALAWSRLEAAAQAGGVALLATATVGGGTPLLPTLRALHAERPIRVLRATLSGTLGVVVPRVKAGASLEDAVAEAQAAGFCEPDPAFDLDGTDAWVKACILHNSLWPHREPIGLDSFRPLRLDEEAVRVLRTPAVVAELRPGQVVLGLQDWGESHGPGIQVRATTEAGIILLGGTGAGPEATARTLLADVEALPRFGPGIH